MTRWAWIVVGGALGLAAILAIALVVAIASGGDDASDADAVPPAAEAPEGGHMIGPLGGGMPAEVSECLEEQGVEAPGADGTPPDAEEIERMRAALEECGLPAPQIVTPGS